MLIQKVVIIIPTYNEAAGIEDTLFEVFQAVACVPDMDVHVLVFDSASTDNTQQIVKQLQASNPSLHLQTEQKKTGLGSAYLQAMRYALDHMSADIIFEFDADLSHQPKYLSPMLEKMKTYDAVVGSRYVRGGTTPKQWGFHRKLLSVLGNYIARLILTPKYKDFTSGFRATHRRALTKALPDAFLSNNYAYKLELFWKLHQNKARIFEYPIAFIDRQKGQSKLPANSIIDSLRVLFTLRFQGLKRYAKMCLVGLSGVFVQFLTYNLLRQTLSPLHAAQLAVLAAIVNNFILNNHFTFKSLHTYRRQKIKAFGLFCGYSLLMIGVQSYWLHWGVKYLGSGYLEENLIMIAGIVIGSLLNYLTYSRVVWRDKKLKLPLQEF